jgi:hypothetical protein
MHFFVSRTAVAVSATKETSVPIKDRISCNRPYSSRNGACFVIVDVPLLSLKIKDMWNNLQQQMSEIFVGDNFTNVNTLCR